MKKQVKNEIEILSVKSLQFPHQLVGLDKTDWNCFLICCDNYPFKDFVKGWQNGIAHEIIIGYFQYKDRLLKTMTSIFDGILIGCLFFDGHPIMTVTDSDIVLVNTKLYRQGNIGSIFEYLLEVIHEYGDHSLTSVLQKRLANERRISTTVRDFKLAGLHISIRSKYQIYSISDLKTNKHKWETYLKTIDVEPSEETEFLVTEWLLSLAKTKHTFVDICAWPRDDHYGCIYVDDELAYTNTGGKLSAIVDKWKRIENMFEQIRSHELMS